MSPRLHLWRVIRATIACVALAAPALAADPVIDAKGFQHNRDYFSAGPTEHIDTMSGNLILTYTDLALPGDAGHDLQFQRTFNLKEGRWRFGSPQLPLVIDSAQRSNPQTGEIFYPTIVDATGAEHPTTITGTNGRWAFTLEFWKFDRDNRVLYLPDGSFVLYDTSLRPIENDDAFGNRITVNYAPAATTITQCFDASCLKQRLVQITYADAPSAPDLSRMPMQLTYGTHTFSYTGGNLLTAVTPPTGPGWQYAYAGTVTSPGGAGSLTVTSPQGGTTRFDVEQHPYLVPHDGSFVVMDTIYSPVVRFRTVGGRAVQGGMWQYAYSFETVSTDIANHTVVTAPSGAVTTFDYAWTGANQWLGPLWDNPPTTTAFPGSLSAMLMHRSLTGSDGAVLEDEQRKYAQINHVTGFWSPELVKQTISRAGRNYVTTYGFHVTVFADYHRPWQVIESGELGRTTTRTFDATLTPAFGDLTGTASGRPSFISKLNSETVTVGSGSFTHSWTFDPSTGFTVTDNAYGITTSFSPDAQGNVARATLGNGTYTDFDYDWGVVSGTQNGAYGISRGIYPEGTVQSETRGGRTTSFTYDDLFRVTTTSPPASNPVTTTYADAGDTVTVTRGASRTVTTVDGFGRPVQTQTDSADGIITTTTTYDAEGRKTFESLPAYGATLAGTEFVYDDLGRVLEQWHHDQNGVRMPGYVHLAYDAGQVMVTDENGHTTTRSVAAFGNPDETRLVGVKDAMGQSWSYSYNALGKLTQVAAPGGVNRTWVYDSHNLLTSETHPESGTTVYDQYDGSGLLRHKTDANGVATSFGYDLANRPASVTALSDATTYTYYPGAEERETTTVNGAVSFFGYDAAGRLNRRVDSVAGLSFGQNATYDNNDNIATLTYPSGRVVTYTYDAANRVTSVTAGIFNAAGTETSQPYASNFHYHPSGALTTYRTANNVDHTFTYDPARYWLTDIQAGALHLTYQNYDNVGNVRHLGDARSGQVQDITYDPLDRLQTAQGSYGPMQFDYDPHGNRVTNGYGAYTYDTGFHLRAQLDQTFTYDANGNLKTGPYNGDQYTYTSANQLATSTVGGNSDSYQYDADGWRIARTDRTGTSGFARGPNGQLLGEVRSSGILRDYLYAGGRLIGMIRKVQTGSLPVVTFNASYTTNGAVGAGFTAQSQNNLPLTSAGLDRAISDTNCTIAATTSCSWSQVASASAPANTKTWTAPSTALVDPTPPAGTTLLYRVRVTDSDGLVGTAAPAQVSIANDTLPDPFTIVDQTGAALSTAVLSAIVPITGISTSVTVTVTGGASYRVCADALCAANGAFVASGTPIANGQYLQVRLTSAAAYATAVSTTITVGTGGGTTWHVTTATQDTTPDAFSFTDQTGVTVNTVTTSNIVAISGITGSVAVSITAGGGSFRMCSNGTCSTNPAFGTAAASITNGQFLQLRVTSSTSSGTAVSTVVTVGTASDTWSVTTVGQDTTPDPFSFADQTGLALNTVTLSNIVAITGVTGTVGVSATGGTYRVCADATCATNPAFVSTAGSLTNGKFLQLRATSGSTVGATVNTIVTVGTASDTWSVTTLTQDTTPDAFSFTDITSTTVSTVTTSNILPITGITGNVTVSISAGGAYRVCTTSTCTSNPAFVTTAGVITNGQFLQLRQTSSAAFSTTVSTTVTVGSATDNWSVTTSQDTTPDAFSFTDQTGAAPSVVTTSNALAITGITGSVAVSISGSGGSYRVCTNSTCSSNPAFVTTAGVITNGQFLQLRLTSSTAFNTAVSTVVTVGTGSDNWSVTTAAASNVVLTTAKTGGGQGTIAGNGINCGSTCQKTLASGTAVTLTATPSAGQTFAGWSGGVCSGTGTCSFTIASNVTVTANFTCTAPTGGSVTSAGGYTTHRFTSNGTFNAGSCITSADYLIVAAGGSGGGLRGGGGGGGGVQNGSTSVSATSYAVVVGQGSAGNNGGNSSVFGVTATGGGRGADEGGNGASGGSGGGGSGPGTSGGSGVSGQGTAGGGGELDGSYVAGGGGGGAASAGTQGWFGPGGAGRSVWGTSYGGGGGGNEDQGSGTGGDGGGGNGGAGGNPSSQGVDALGGGGGGGESKRGGHGVVLIRYPSL